MSRRKNNSFKLKNKNEISSNISDANLECDPTVVDLTEEPNINVEHGTPLRHDVSTQQDYLNLDYRSFLPQTQDGGVEVTWDWHSPGRNKNIGTNGKNSKTHEICCSSTPKRSTDIQKKRISNSPLMYKPLKRKLIKAENTDDIDKFKAELIALSEKIKKGEDDRENLANKLEDTDETDIPINMKFRDLHNDENDIVVCDENTEFLMQNKNCENQNFDDLFNDSLNDTMIKCSQEIEERLNIAPVKSKGREYSSTAIHNENGKSVAQKNCYSSSTYINKNKFDNNTATKFNSTNGQETTLIKHKSDSGMSKKVIKTTIPSSNTAPTVGQIYSTSMPNNEKIDSNSQVVDQLHIPDDSFDEFLATCEEDFSQSDMDFPSTTTRYGKVYDNLNSMSPKKSNISLSKVSSDCSSSMKVQTINNAPKRDTVRKNIAANIGVSNSTVQSNNLAIGSNSTSTSNRNWKFFKSKSYSDSSFATDTNKDTRSSTKSGNQIGSHYLFKGRCSSNENSKSGSRESSSSSVSTEHQIRRTTSCLDSNAMAQKSTQKNNTNNMQMYNVNRYGAKEDGRVNSKNRIIQNAGDVASGIQSLQLCGPEEIERKRREAKMKLEAKKKREKMRSNSDNTMSRVPVKSQNNR
ncbi:hypothetical protein PV325_003805 [Microctonus aethiopoides]|uniref:Uncharacterized protein n=1 Tax=Microctonus aethiopoides TaxID=144406 RepID=A0AA39F831_9HYME|nr:hypothetical protein PV325_003805 [Microctonus aethiopoides]KAK0164685.1 hypothetical protein PV328_003280 [Microctonus aethiopoides]